MIPAAASYLRSVFSKDPRDVPVLLPTAFWIVCGVDLAHKLIPDSAPLSESEKCKTLQLLSLCWRGVGWSASSDRFAPFSVLATLSAIQILVILNEPIPDRELIIERLKAGVSENGVSMSCDRRERGDIRFTYCLISCLHLLGVSLDDVCEPLSEFIHNCQAPEGGFSCAPSGEAHGGHTFCAIASLGLLGVRVKREGLLRDWLDRRGGIPGRVTDRVDQPSEPCTFNGRPCKQSDICYGWWVGATVAMLGPGNFSNQLDLTSHNQAGGGFSPRPGEPADFFHTFFGLASLALAKKLINPFTALPK